MHTASFLYWSLTAQPLVKRHCCSKGYAVIGTLLFQRLCCNKDIGVYIWCISQQHNTQIVTSALYYKARVKRQAIVTLPFSHHNIETKWIRTRWIKYFTNLLVCILISLWGLPNLLFIESHYPCRYPVLVTNCFQWKVNEHSTWLL